VPFSDLKTVDEALWDSVMDVNLKGTYLVCRAAALRMREQDGGAIVNITSSAGVLPSGSSIPYSVSKAAVIHLTKALAIGLAPKIRVNTVAPSLMLTRWWDGHDASVKAWIDASRFKKPLDLEDVARATVFLATTESISGQTLLVDQANYFL
jgi:NAD(P)-dependent dehydrogenase (short-subunit alcohol dehydrogenase family)